MSAFSCSPLSRHAQSFSIAISSRPVATATPPYTPTSSPSAHARALSVGTPRSRSRPPRLCPHTGSPTAARPPAPAHRSAARAHPPRNELFPRRVPSPSAEPFLTAKGAAASNLLGCEVSFPSLSAGEAPAPPFPLLRCYSSRPRHPTTAEVLFENSAFSPPPGPVHPRTLA